MTSAATIVDGTTGEIIDPKAWAEEHFEAIARAEVSAWDIVLDLAREWDTGLCVSQHYPDTRKGYEGRTMTIAMALKAYWDEGRAAAPVGRTYAKDLANAAQVYIMAGDEWQDVTPYALRPFGPPARWTPERVQERLRSTQERYGEVTSRTVTQVLHPHKSKSSGGDHYWGDVATELMMGHRGLTVAHAENIIASAQYWLDEQRKAKK